MTPVHFLNKVRRYRKLQKQYLQTRQQNDLILVKQMGREIDQSLKHLPHVAPTLNISIAIGENYNIVTTLTGDESTTLKETHALCRQLLSQLETAMQNSGEMATIKEVQPVKATVCGKEDYETKVERAASAKMAGAA